MLDSSNYLSYAAPSTGYDKANSAGNDAVNAYTNANSALMVSGSAFDKANSAGTSATAGAAWNTANNAYAQANTGTLYAQSAFAQANLAYTIIPSWNTANNAYLKANSAGNDAVNAFFKANSAPAAWNTANNAYLQANTAVNNALSAFNKANTGTSASIVDDTATNANRPLVFTSNTNGQAFTGVYMNSTELYTNPSTGTLYATIFSSLSDRTQKDNITTIENAIEIINNIDPVSFNWKRTGKKSYGVIAQEIEKVLPELVHENEGIKSVEYDSLIAILISAVKELTKRVEELENK